MTFFDRIVVDRAALEAVFTLGQTVITCGLGITVGERSGATDVASRQSR